ncbi:MAG: hypothetical protein KC609_07600 [Myxococcales bacterium]|nr:hypothetical protein [Myxococcales bacterium]
MCLICLDFQNQRLTLDEARRAFGEMASTLDPDHRAEVEEMLEQAAHDEAESND